jgi:methyl-accepting chemotaxis protein WspA
VSEVAVGDIREVRILDARSSAVVTRIVDDNGNPAESALPLDDTDATLVREAINSGRPAGRAVGAMYRVAAPVVRADGVTGGAVLVGVVSRAGADLWRWELLAGALSSLLVGLPAVLAASWLVRSTTESMRVSTEVSESIAAGDLSSEVPPGGVGEAGRLLDGIGRMSATLRETVGRVQAAGAKVTAVESEVSVALARQERVVRGFSGSVSDISGASSQLSSNAEQLLDATGTVTLAAREAARVADDGRYGLERMSESMRQLDEVMNAFTRKLTTIRQRAGGINAVVTTIAKVADQTNLLSINAAIEAEKAGEYGLGFLVVAREIRRLADQTAVASLDIERMVKEMQNAVSAGVMEMDKFADQVRGGVSEIGEISARLGDIISAVQGISGRFGQVTEGMRAQSQGAEQIREAMVRLAEGAARTAESLNDFNGATIHLREAVGDLKEEVSRFTI